MSKFNESDFEYVEKVKSPFGDYYVYFVDNESASYLKSKYKLSYHNIYVHLFEENIMTAVSKTGDSLNIHIHSIEKEDIEELLPILKKKLISGIYKNFSTGCSC